MSTTKIADKTTLDNVKTDTNTLLSRGGIKSDGTNISAYNSTTTNWDNVNISGGSGSSIITIVNKDSAFTNKQFTIKYQDNPSLFSTTVTMTGDSINVEVPYIGTYIMTWQDSVLSSDISQSVQVSGYGNFTTIPFIIEDASFSTCDNTTLSLMLDAYYSDNINLTDYWSIGDERPIYLNAITSVASTFSQMTGKDYIFTLLDFNYDTLVDPINNHTKAAVTLMAKESVTTGKMDSNSPAYTQQWAYCARRNWCNGAFYNSFNDFYKPLIKQTIKQSYSTVNANDYCSIINSGELTSNNRYSYFQTTSNYVKSYNYWTRTYTTGYVYPSGQESYYYYMTTSGSVTGSQYYTTYSYGILPLFSL